MSDSIPEDAWVQCFLSSPPRPLLTSLQKRLQASTTHVNALAELFKQRAAIESTYADSLAKLAKTAEQGGLSGKSGNEWDRGGGEAKIWESTVQDLVETSSSHSTLAAVLKTDFEQPLREMPSKIVAWKRIGEQDSSLDKTLKDYEKTSAKLEKASGKKSSKSDQLSNELSSLTQSLSSLSPLVYMTYQKLDEERLKGLKEVAVRWGTMRGDVASRAGQRAEASVAGMLGWETGDEVLAVGTRMGGSGGGGGRSASVAPSVNSTPKTTRRLSTATNQTDFSPRPTIRSNGSTSQPSSSFGGGLKSMLGRTKTLARPGANRNRSNSNTTSIRSNTRDFSAVDEEPPTTTNNAPIDEDGFSVPPSNRHREPWDDPEEETINTPTIQPNVAGGKAPSVASSNPPPASFAQTFSSSPNASSENLEPTPAPRLNLAIADAPIQESEEERQAALAKMQQTLPMPVRRATGTARGRRDVRNTMFAGEDGGLISPAIQPPVIARQTSVSSIGSNNPFDSPALGTTSAFAPTSEPGLRASMTESLNVVLRGGSVQRMQINGEIQVNLNGTPNSPEPVHIRLSSFEVLDKIAPNPQYLSQVPNKPGEYFLDPQALSAASKAALLFRYQGHVEPGSESSTLPLTFDPRFQAKEGDTRMIMTYKTTRALPNLTLSAVFGPGPAVTNVQSRPAGGNWSAIDRQMTWKAEEAEGKIVAKFASEPGETLSPKNVQANWKVEGSLVTGLGIEVVGEGWKFEEVLKNLQAGKYIAELADPL